MLPHRVSFVCCFVGLEMESVILSEISRARARDAVEGPACGSHQLGRTPFRPLFIFGGNAFTTYSVRLTYSKGQYSIRINGRRSITGDTALRLAHFFGTGAEFWLNLQGLYEIRTAQAKLGNTIRALPTIKTLPARHPERLDPEIELDHAGCPVAPTCIRHINVASDITPRSSFQ